MEFKAFPKIQRFSKLEMLITQKIHGTNAGVIVSKDYNEGTAVQALSRTRLIYPGDDNYGFAQYVKENHDAFMALGEGYHYGEWCGPGINSGEGLTERRFLLFDIYRYGNVTLPPQTDLVPELYLGPFSIDTIKSVMKSLKENGSKLVPGFMRPEGIVVQFAGHRYKEVFDSEEISWKQAPVKVKKIKEAVDYSYLCQPIRLQKLLSRDERYLRDYPNSLPVIVKDYTNDLLEEGQLKESSRSVANTLFKFIKVQIDLLGGDL